LSKLEKLQATTPATPAQGAAPVDAAVAARQSSKLTKVQQQLAALEAAGVNGDAVRQQLAADKAALAVRIH
jgi:hypothetical protein